MSNSVTLQNNGLAWSYGGSSIYDNGNLTIATDDTLVITAPTVTVGSSQPTTTINPSVISTGYVYSYTGQLIFGLANYSGTNNGYIFSAGTDTKITVQSMPGEQGNGVPLYWSTANNVIFKGVSSIKYKENIINLPDDRYNIQNFMKLKPVLYNIKNHKQKKIGFIAENAANLLLDELVVYNSNNEIEYFNYDQMTSFITKIVQEQQKQLEEQQKQLEEQQKQLEEQKKEINELRDLILSKL